MGSFDGGGLGEDLGEGLAAQIKLQGLLEIVPPGSEVGGVIREAIGQLRRMRSSIQPLVVQDRLIGQAFRSARAELEECGESPASDIAGFLADCGFGKVVRIQALARLKRDGRVKGEIRAGRMWLVCDDSFATPAELRPGCSRQTKAGATPPPV